MVSLQQVPDLHPKDGSDSIRTQAVRNARLDHRDPDLNSPVMAQRATGSARTGQSSEDSSSGQKLRASGSNGDRQIGRNLPKALRHGAQRDHQGQARQKSEPISRRGTFSRHNVLQIPGHNTVSGQSNPELPPSPRKWLAGKVVLGPYLTLISRKETVNKAKTAGNKAAANPWNCPKKTTPVTHSELNAPVRF
ncbi:hypothetical protein ON010_g18491 [Phytophthora cinnamomi]|nr:hypothetical protein ON010_g18491 [Phytophthora cinnamomi]